MPGSGWKCPRQGDNQTYNPESDVILRAASQDYKSFYKSEIRLRKALCFPPFCDIAVITLSSADEGYLGMMTNLMFDRIKEHIRDDYHDIPMMLFGPFEAPLYRVQNMYRMPVCDKVPPEQENARVYLRPCVRVFTPISERTCEKVPVGQVKRENNRDG